GSINFNGKNLVGQSAHNIVGLGLSHVPEGRRIFNVLTVQENLNLGGYLIRSKGHLVKERKDAAYTLFPRLAARRRQPAGRRSGASCSRAKPPTWPRTSACRRPTWAVSKRSLAHSSGKKEVGRAVRPTLSLDKSCVTWTRPTGRSAGSRPARTSEDRRWRVPP